MLYVRSSAFRASLGRFWIYTAGSVRHTREDRAFNFPIQQNNSALPWPRTAQQKQGETQGYSGISFASDEIRINIALVLWKQQEIMERLKSEELQEADKMSPVYKITLKRYWKQHNWIHWSRQSIFPRCRFQGMQSETWKAGQSEVLNVFTAVSSCQWYLPSIFHKDDWSFSLSWSVGSWALQLWWKFLCFLG